MIYPLLRSPVHTTHTHYVRLPLHVVYVPLRVTTTLHTFDTVYVRLVYVRSVLYVTVFTFTLRFVRLPLRCAHCPGCWFTGSALRFPSFIWLPLYHTLHTPFPYIRSPFTTHILPSPVPTFTFIPHRLWFGWITFPRSGLVGYHGLVPTHHPTFFLRLVLWFIWLWLVIYGLLPPFSAGSR